MNSFKALNSISKIAVSLANTNQPTFRSLNAIVDEVVELIELEDFLLYLADPIERKLKQLAVADNKRSKNGSIKNELEIHFSMGIVGSAAANQCVERIADTVSDPRYIQDDQIRLSELSVPIVKNDTVIGVIDSEHPSKNYFSDCHVQAFTILGQLFVPILDQFRRSEQRSPNYYFTEFIRLLEEDKIYRDQTLSLTKVSEVLHIHPAYLSKIISDASSSSFSSILNKYRVNEVKKMFTTEQYRAYSTLGMAFEAGFNSKATFNRAFKKHTSLSPIEFRKQRKEVSKF